MIETMERSLYSKKYETLRNWLKEERLKQEGLSIRELAKRPEVHHSIVGKIEQGERKLDIIEYVDYCDALGVDPNLGLDIIQQ